MTLVVRVAKTTTAGADWALVGRGTCLVRYVAERSNATNFRALLAAVERESARIGFPLTQAVYYLPNLMMLEDAFDIASAATSFLRRHAEIRQVTVVGPLQGLIRVVVDAALRAMPGVSMRFVAQADDTLLCRLRAVEPNLAPTWFELDHYAKSG
jgi:hypothetical protein